MTSTLDLNAVLADLGPRCAGAAARHDADDSFVAEAYAALREARVFSALVPTDFGGGGCSHAQMCRFLRQLARHCPSTALALSMHQHLVAAAAANHRAGRPGRALLEKVGANELVLVSTGANDWLDSNGSAEPVDGGFRVTAVKPFASGSPAGDVLVTSAAIAGGGEVLHFPIPLGADGISGLGDWAALGMRGTGSQTLKLDEVFVPEDAVVLRRPQGPFQPAFAVILTVAMPIILSAHLGVADGLAVAGFVDADRPDTTVLLGDRVAADPAEPVLHFLADLERFFVGRGEFVLVRPDAMTADDVEIHPYLLSVCP